MITKPRYLTAFFYTTCLILAAGCFYFSISEGLFAWFLGDELIASQSYHNVGGFFACAKYYYLHTTINRMSAASGLCLMAKSVTLLSTPFLGWVFSRLVFYALVPVSMAFLLKEVVKIPFKLSLSIALTISAAAFFVISNDVYYMFGLDLAIYGTATFTFLTLAALFQKSIKDIYYFRWFCLVYALNLNSHEIFLVISGFFIPLYAWYYYSINQLTLNKKISLRRFINNALQNRRVWMLAAIYVASALATLLAPGVEIRQHIWPSTGSFFDGLTYMLQSIEEVAYFVARFYVLFILIFLLGVVFRLSAMGNKYSGKNKLFYAFLFIAPLVYLLLAGFLLGITPSLWAGSARSGAFRLLEPFLTHLVTNQAIFTQGGFAIRQELFLYVSLFLNSFLGGFLVAAPMRKYAKAAIIKNAWSSKICLLSAVIMILLFHPDGAGSMRILSTFFKSHVDLTHYSPQKNKKAHPENSITAMPTFSNIVFPRKRPGNHESDVTNIVVDKYLKANRGKAVSSDTVDLVYDLMIRAYSVIRRPEWQRVIYPLYKVFPQKKEAT